jgi:adenylosuccinate synthase
MAVTCVLGTQWGDEGKAKIVDLLAREMDYVVRFQGGANAGHTVVIGDKKHIFHVVPSGVFHPRVKCVIANGVVFDPEEFFKELDALKSEGIDTSGRIYLSGRAHVVLPYHKRFDLLREKALDAGKIGTTARGIGPAYSDKMNRSTAVRICDLYTPGIEEKIGEILKEKNAIFKALYGDAGFEAREILKQVDEWRKKIEPYVTDTVQMLSAAARTGKAILLEGAQGSLLDVDFGTYPFVTSSNTTLAGASAGTGIAPRLIGRVIGITKAYTTRVGSGPFPTEEKGEIGEHLRTAGGEFGSTTGRPRRCGWFDLVGVRYSVEVSGIDEIAITKLDVLSGLKTIKVCKAYQKGGKTTTAFPSSTAELAELTPVYDTLKGWERPVSGARRIGDLPSEAREYLKYLEENIGRPISMASVGSDRDALVIMGGRK